MSENHITIGIIDDGAGSQEQIREIMSQISQRSAIIGGWRNTGRSCNSGECASRSSCSTNRSRTAKVAPFKDEAFKFRTLVVEATTNGAVPVTNVEVSWPLIPMVVIPERAPAARYLKWQRLESY